MKPQLLQWLPSVGDKRTAAHVDPKQWEACGRHWDRGDTDRQRSGVVISKKGRGRGRPVGKSAFCGEKL